MIGLAVSLSAPPSSPAVLFAEQIRSGQQDSTEGETGGAGRFLFYLQPTAHSLQPRGSEMERVMGIDEFVGNKFGQPSGCP